MDGWPDYKPGPRFDVGIATSEALERIKRAVPAATAGGRDDRSNGNGSLMRILPIALVGHALPVARLVEQACRTSSVTHGHARSQVCCTVFCLVAQALLAGNSDRDSALARAFVDALDCLDSTTRAELVILRDYPDRSGSGYVVDSFWSAWDAFRSADSYGDAIECAVGFGNDTDTTAAIAGGLAGAYWGVGAIPVDWLYGVRGRDIVEPMIARLLDTAAVS